MEIHTKEIILSKLNRLIDESPKEDREMFEILHWIVFNVPGKETPTFNVLGKESPTQRVAAAERLVVNLKLSANEVNVLIKLLTEVRKHNNDAIFNDKEEKLIGRGSIEPGEWSTLDFLLYRLEYLGKTQS